MFARFKNPTGNSQNAISGLNNVSFGLFLRSQLASATAQAATQAAVAAAAAPGPAPGISTAAATAGGMQLNICSPVISSAGNLWHATGYNKHPTGANVSNTSSNAHKKASIHQDAIATNQDIIIAIMSINAPRPITISAPVRNVAICPGSMGISPIFENMLLNALNIFISNVNSVPNIILCICLVVNASFSREFKLLLLARSFFLAL